MYMRKSTRQRLHRAGFLLLALVILMPKLELPAPTEVIAFFDVLGFASQVG
jgi:hypothetical protein